LAQGKRSGVRKRYAMAVPAPEGVEFAKAGDFEERKLIKDLFSTKASKRKMVGKKARGADSTILP